MAGRRICAGYYRRYDGKVVYVISTATDADTGEETVIWTSYPFADVPRYCTSSKKSFCAFVKVDGERKAKYKRQINMKISAAAIERLEDEGFRGPVRKRHRRQLDEEYDSREYTHVTDAMRQNAADKIDRGIGRAESKPRQESAPQKPAPSTFQAHKGQRRKPGNGCVSQINGHLWEGRYSPIVNGQRMARNVYAKTEAECEKKLAELIREMKAEIAAGKKQTKQESAAS